MRAARVGKWMVGGFCALLEGRRRGLFDGFSREWVLFGSHELCDWGLRGMLCMHGIVNESLCGVRNWDVQVMQQQRWDKKQHREDCL